MHPRFSVVIPTRERAATLPYTLRTCLDQDFDDYEIVVCDNHSSPATRAVVDAVRHPRIRYVRAPHPLAMSDNWELAVEHARGEYVTVLGDDDALLSHALGEVDRVIARTGARAIRWVVAFYTWPAVALEGEGNYLGVPLMRELHTVDAVTALDAVIGFRESYGYLPMLYNGVIHRDLIAELRQKTGRVFRSPIPDIYSGMAFAYLAGSYVSLDVPMAVSGISGTSNGVANMLVRGPTPVAEEFRRLNAATGLRTHPHVPDLSPVVPLAAAVADSFQHAKDALFPTDNRLTLDRRLLAEKCVQSLWAPDEGTWQTRLGRIRATFADDPDAQAWFDREHANAPFRPAPPPARAVTRPPGYDGSQLHLRADAFGVTDVAGAARLCEQILGARGAPVAYDLPGLPWLNSHIARLHEQLAVSEADRAARLEVIHTLNENLIASEADRAERLRLIHTLNADLIASVADRAAQAERIRLLEARISAERPPERRPPGRIESSLGWLRRAPSRALRWLAGGLTPTPQTRS